MWSSWPCVRKSALNFDGVVEDVGHVRDDDVDAERGRVGKHHPAVDEDGFVAALVDHQVHPDLAETAERDDAESRPRSLRLYSLTDKCG